MKVNRVEQASLLKLIGERLKEAREMNNLTQQVASKRLGYDNSTKLSKVEGASDTFSVPVFLLIKAAKIYDVSMDWLCGRSNDWESTQDACEERNFSQWMFDAWETARKKDMSLLLRAHKKFLLVERMVDELAAATAEIDAALTRFRQLHPEFDEMRSSRLIGAVERGANIAAVARAKIARFKLECRLASRAEGNPQLELLTSGP